MNSINGQEKIVYKISQKQLEKLKKYGGWIRIDSLLPPQARRLLRLNQ